MQIFDSHTHINAWQFAQDIPDVIERALAMEVKQMLIVAYDQESAQRMLPLIEKYDHFYGAVGIHPDSADKYDDRMEKWLLDLLKHEKVKVLGEIGLDYHNEVDHDQQKAVFKRQLDLAKELNMPVTIHNRDAIFDTYPILKAAQVDQFGGIMHSFNGDQQWAQKFLELGMYLSYSGVVTFGNAKEVLDAALNTPLDKILVETDAPYLTPLPFRGRLNEPAMTRYTLEFLAQKLGLSAQELAQKTTENTERILGI
ncbi:TatD family hydrolase [Ligilactobacillus equi]|nr:TatD family hydrolase [Ligilactobacillus sp.]